MRNPRTSPTPIKAIFVSIIKRFDLKVKDIKKLLKNYYQTTFIINHGLKPVVNNEVENWALAQHKQ